MTSPPRGVRPGNLKSGAINYKGIHGPNGPPKARRWSAVGSGPIVPLDTPPSPKKVAKVPASGKPPHARHERGHGHGHAKHDRSHGHAKQGHSRGPARKKPGARHDEDESYGFDAASPKKKPAGRAHPGSAPNSRSKVRVRHVGDMSQAELIKENADLKAEVAKLKKALAALMN